MATLSEVLRGNDIAPLLVSLGRGLIEAMVMAALAAALIYLTAVQIEGLPDWAMVLIVAAGTKGIRLAEGLADQIDANSKRAPERGDGQTPPG